VAIIAPEGDPMNRYAGLDWASEIHAVCVIDETGEVRERLRVPHTRLGLAELVSRLARHADRESSGAAGRTASPTTRPSTAASTVSARRSPDGRG